MQTWFGSRILTLFHAHLASFSLSLSLSLSALYLCVGDTFFFFPNNSKATFPENSLQEFIFWEKNIYI